MRPPGRPGVPRPDGRHAKPQLHQGVRGARPAFRGRELTASQDTARGLAATITAFALWGIIPLYWKILAHLSAAELLCHRIAWSLPWLAALLFLRRRWPEVGRALRHPRTRPLLIASTLLITFNWGTFLWAISHDRVLDSSLGYYINPLVSVLLGFVFLGERLDRMQGAAVVLAAAGVVLLTVRHGLPWVSLVLAFSFGTYGLVRKVVDVAPMPGLFVEIALLTPVTLGYIVWLGARGEGAFGRDGTGTSLLLAAAGPVTVFPLLLFSDGIRRLRLATVGFLQYMTPTGHFLLAVMVFGEPFDTSRLAAFALIWTALAVYTVDLRRRLSRRPVRPAA